jgi:RNA polymerase sigma factor (sigma-70 family)
MDIETHLLIISDKETNRNEAQNSISLLYEKYRKFVYNITYRNISFTLQKEELALSVVSDVFLKIWESPLDWEFDSTIHETPEDGFKAYLSTIAHFKLLEELRKIKASRENEVNIIDDDDSEWKWALIDEEFDYLDKDLIKKRNIIDECLLEFTERNRDIIRMYFFLYDDEKNMTREKITLMETLFETTWQNIRQIIHRSKSKIKTILEEKLQIK